MLFASAPTLPSGQANGSPERGNAVRRRTTRQEIQATSQLSVSRTADVRFARRSSAQGFRGLPEFSSCPYEGGVTGEPVPRFPCIVMLVDAPPELTPRSASLTDRHQAGTDETAR